MLLNLYSNYKQCGGSKGKQVLRETWNRCVLVKVRSFMDQQPPWTADDQNQNKDEKVGVSGDDRKCRIGARMRPTGCLIRRWGWTNFQIFMCWRYSIFRITYSALNSFHELGINAPRTWNIGVTDMQLNFLGWTIANEL